jgi:hypothetical protein
VEPLRIKIISACGGALTLVWHCGARPFLRRAPLLRRAPYLLRAPILVLAITTSTCPLYKYKPGRVATPSPCSPRYLNPACVKSSKPLQVNTPLTHPCRPQC